jgi:hypothetical protein
MRGDENADESIAASQNVAEIFLIVRQYLTRK